MKEKIKKTTYLLLTLFLIFLIVYIVSYSFFNFLYKFNIINSTTSLILTFCSAILIIIISIIMHKLSKRIMLISRIEKWIGMYFYRVLMFAIVFLFFSNSLDSEVFMSTENAKDVMTIQWTIFGISVTIFMVWNILVQEVFSKKLNFANKEEKIIILKDYFYNKKMLIENIKSKSFTLNLLIINIFVLIFATATLYVVKGEFSILKQTLVIFSFYFCTNTLVQLFTDILQPLLKKKKEMMEYEKIDKNIDSLIEQTIVIYDQINALEISDKEKQENNKKIQIIIDKICEMKGIECIQEKDDKEIK